MRVGALHPWLLRPSPRPALPGVLRLPGSSLAAPDSGGLSNGLGGWPVRWGRDANSSKAWGCSGFADVFV